VKVPNQLPWSRRGHLLSSQGPRFGVWVLGFRVYPAMHGTTNPHGTLKSTVFAFRFPRENSLTSRLESNKEEKEVHPEIYQARFPIRRSSPDRTVLDA